MIEETARPDDPIRTVPVVVISAMALILVAASADYGPNWERIRAMPAAQRARLLENLRKFDQVLPPEQQSAIRDLDRRLAEMPPDQRAAYLSVLRRYHDWVNGLSEARQDELEAKPAGDRMGLIRNLLKEHPAPTGNTPTLLAVAQTGELSPFELASAYKIWKAATPKQRTQIESQPGERQRREALFRVGARLNPAIPRETIPEDFDEPAWIDQVPAYWRKARPIMSVEKKADEAVKNRVEAFRLEIVRRQAISLYLGQSKPASVQPDRLTQFASALPTWIQDSLDPLPPDEAKRRLTLAYRQVFVPPDEIGSTHPSAGHQTKAAPRPAAPAKPKHPAAGPGSSTAPF